MRVQWSGSDVAYVPLGSFAIDQDVCRFVASFVLRKAGHEPEMPKSCQLLFVSAFRRLHLGVVFHPIGHVDQVFL